MFNLIKKDFLLMLSSKITLFTFLLFLPFYQILLADGSNFPIYLISIITLSYMLTTMSFAFEERNKPYIMLNSLPIKSRDIVISKYIQMFINYIIAVAYTFVYLKLVTFFNISVPANFNISTLKQAFILIVLSLCISLPLQFKLPSKMARFINILIYVSIMNYFSTYLEDSLFYDSNTIMLFALVFVTYFLSMGLSLLLYKNRDLS